MNILGMIENDPTKIADMKAPMVIVIVRKFGKTIYHGYDKNRTYVE